MENIAKMVAEYYGIWFPLLFSHTKKRHIVKARQVSMYLARYSAKLAVSDIGVYFGRTHSTVIIACQKAENDIFSNVKYRNEIQELKEKTKNLLVPAIKEKICYQFPMKVYRATA